MLREIVLERIRAVNVYIRSDVDGFQEEYDKKKLEQAKKRLADLDVIISRLYEDYVLGNLNQDRYRKMSADYEAEQERLKLEIEVTEEWVEQREEMNDGLDAFIALTQKYVDVEELTQTIVNEYIKKIVVYAPDKSGGKRTQKVKIYFNFVDDVDIPVISGNLKKSYKIQNASKAFGGAGLLVLYAYEKTYEIKRTYKSKRLAFCTFLLAFYICFVNCLAS